MKLKFQSHKGFLAVFLNGMRGSTSFVFQIPFRSTEKSKSKSKKKKNGVTQNESAEEISQHV